MSHGKEGDDITPPPAQQPMQTAAFGGLSTDPVAFQNVLYPFGTAVPPPLTSWAPPYVATLPSPYYLQAMAPAGYMNYSAAVPPGHWSPSSYAPPPPAPTYVTHHQHHLPSATGQHMVSMGTPLNAPPFAPYVHSTFLPSYALPQLPTTLDPSSFQATARAVPTAATLVETLPRGTDMTPMSANVPNAPPPPQVVDNVRFSSAKQKRRPKPRNLPAPAPGHTDCTQLVVFYLALEINDVGLGQLFSPFEGFLHGRVVVDSSTGVSRGFGYLWFDTQERAMAVIEAASGRVVLGKRLRIDFANPQSPYTPSS